MVFLGRKVRIKLKHLTVFKLVLHECTWSNNQLMELQQYYLISRVCHNSTVLSVQLYQSHTLLWMTFGPFFFTLLQFIQVCRYSLMQSSPFVLPTYHLDSFLSFF